MHAVPPSPAEGLQLSKPNQNAIGLLVWKTGRDPSDVLNDLVMSAISNAQAYALNKSLGEILERPMPEAPPKVEEVAEVEPPAPATGSSEDEEGG